MCARDLIHYAHERTIGLDFDATNQLGYPLGLSVFLNDIIETRQIGGFCWR
jgi:hypothetical protein